MEVRFEDILVEGKSTGWRVQELDDEDEESSGVLVGYSEIHEMVSQALGSTEVQKYSGLEVQVGFLELVPLVQIVLKVLHDPYLERSWYQVDLHMIQ